jgi:sugar phosphate isomerase/epimerase
LPHSLGISGSTILSNPEQFSQLVREGIDHIEIGEFPDEAALQLFLELNRHWRKSFGVHSPLFRNGSKYDLIQTVQHEPQTAWEQLETEAERLSKLGAEYILVHFPYFADKVEDEADEIIENGLKRLSGLQQKYEIAFVCEPKLGLGRSSAGIEYLHHFPAEIWSRYGMKLCIDIGDYLMGTGDDILNYLLKWKQHIKVVHLHNVLYKEDKYIWIPVHPSQEAGNYFKIERVVRFLAQCENVRFILEHTPHSNPSEAFVEEGLSWIRDLTAAGTLNMKIF